MRHLLARVRSIHDNGIAYECAYQGCGTRFEYWDGAPLYEDSAARSEWEETLVADETCEGPRP